MKLRRNRSASTGRFVDAAEVYSNPSGTVTETQRPAGEARCPHCGQSIQLRKAAK